MGHYIEADEFKPEKEMKRDRGGEEQPGGVRREGIELGKKGENGKE